MDENEIKARIQPLLVGIASVLNEVRDQTGAPVAVFDAQIVARGRDAQIESSLRLAPPIPLIMRLSAEIIDKHNKED